MRIQKPNWRSLSMASALLCSGVTTSLASNDNDWWSMGPVGGSFQVISGQSYIAVRSIEAGSPAELAGMQAGDFITGAYGKSFSTTWGSTEGYKGAPQGFAEAIERAESSDGQMPLTVLRPGVGSVDLTVSLPVAGSFGAAYPLGSSKFDTLYQSAATQIHNAASGSGDQGYMTGFYGMILLADPNWNDTTGAKPYRLSINNMRDAASAWLNGAIDNPVEATNMDGTPNDGSVNDSNPNDQNYVGYGLENWTLSTHAMFLAEYRKKTGDTSVDATVQHAANCLAARIQTWQQPPYDGNSPTKSGLMGHGGVTGDYPHVGYAGINIINAHAMTALAMLKEAGATVDDVKMQASWNWVKGATALWGGGDDGNIGYGWAQGGYDSSGRTAGVAYAMSVYGGLNTADQDILKRMKDYVTRQWQRMQHAHAYTVAGTQFYQFVLPYLPDRDQRFIMENQRMFYHFHRTSSNGITYFGGRENNGGDGYVGTHAVALTNVGMAQAVASGNLTTVAPLDNTRIHAEFKSPFLTWPTLEARRVEIDSLSQAFDVDVVDYQGTVEDAANFTATWSHISGPATATFTSPNTAGTTVNFPQEGTYRIQLEVVKGGYTLTEPIDVIVETSSLPAGYVKGFGYRRVYTGIAGTAISDLTSNAKYPDAPDELANMTSLYTAPDGDNYGERIHGYILAPETGDYTFYVAGDDSAEFKFNAAGTDPAGATTICYLSNATNLHEWTNHASQTSATVSLTKGQLYYYELLHKEAGGAQHASVGWSGPGISTAEVVPGSALVADASPVILSQPVNQSTNLGGSVTFTAVVEGVGPFLYEWKQGTTSLGVGTSSSLTLNNVGAGHIGDYHCEITHAGGSVSTNTVSLTIDDAGILTQGGIWRDQFNSIGGSAITDLTNNSNFPKFPTSGQPFSSAEKADSTEDSYGARWTGWLRADQTGDHYFYITSDDASELWLSTDEQPSNKVKIASVGSYTGVRAWSSGGQSVAVNLVAGQRYYIEVLHKEGGGGDHCSVAWRQPGEGMPANGSAPISGTNLEYFTGGVQGDTVVMPALFNGHSYSYSIEENTSVSQVLGSVSATDTNTPLSYAILTGNAGGQFSIDSVTGELSAVAALDYEAAQSHSLTVEVTNSLGKKSRTNVLVTVTDVLGDDSDADGLDDAWELAQFGDTTSQSGLSDADNDGLSNGDEYLAGSDPNAGDSDSDGFSDGLEFAVGTGIQDALSTPGAEYANLHAWWRLNDSAGTLAKDSTGNGANASFVGVPTWSTGHLDGALSLDGSNDALSIPASASVTGTGGLTVSTWIKTTSTTSGFIIQQRDDSATGYNGEYVLSYGANGTVQFFIYNDGFQFNIATTATVNDGNWHHIAAVRDDVNGYIYIDGVLAAQGSGPLKSLNALGVSIGYDRRDNTSYLNAALDDVRVYSTALDSTQVGVLAGASSNVSPVANDATFAVVENAANGTSVGAVSATDANLGDALVYALGLGNEDGAFAINPNSGEITVAGSIDYESKSIYTLNVLVSDQKGGQDFAEVTINVTDVVSDDSDADGMDDAWEVVHFGDTTSQDGTGDADNDGLTDLVEFQSGTNPTLLDTDNDGYNDPVEVAAGSNGADDQSLPSGEFNGIFAWWKLDETSGTAVSDYTANGHNGTFVNSPTWGTGLDGGALSFDGVDDAVNLGSGASLLGTGDFTLSAWVKTTGTTTAFIMQQRDGSATGYNGEYVLRMNADGTVGFMIHNAGFQFDFDTTATINDGNWHHIAAVRDDVNGYIYIDGVLAAQDSGPLKALENLGVAIGYDLRDNTFFFDGSLDDVRLYNSALAAADVSTIAAGNNSAPVANDATFSIAEDSAVSSSVGTVNATDPGDTLTYAITAGNAGGEFAIDSNTGAITTVGSFDFETTSQYVLTVTVTDSGGLTDTATIMIDVTNVNEAPTANDNSGSVAENVAAGAAITTVTSSDPDAGDSITYAITGGNTGNAFSIDANTGEITTAAMLDFEAVANYSLTVTATDAGGLTDTATVTVTVTNANEAPTANDNSGSVAENVAAGAAIATVTSSDPDAGDSITYSITGGNTGNAFSMDVNTGAITTAAVLDYETAASYTLTVTATDVGGLTDTATVTVTVTNVNESIVANDASGTLAEDAAIGSAVATVTTSDPDAGDSVSFAITSGNTGNAFAIDANGNITTAAALDFETTASYSLTVTATDGGGLSDTATVVVTVTDVNEDPVAADATFALAEDSHADVSVGTATATDPDAGDSVTYAITAGDADGLFAIDSNTGAITLVGALDFEGTPSYALTVTATDAGGLTDTSTVTVNVTDVSEAAFAHWKFDETSGTVAADDTVNLFNGVVGNGGSWVAGKSANALEFDGVDDRVSFGSAPALGGKVPFTISAWVKVPANSNTLQFIMSQRDYVTEDGYNGEYIFRVNANGTLGFMVYKDGYQFDFDTVEVINDGAWHHVAAVRAGNKGLIYIDGVEKATASGAARDLVDTREVFAGVDGRDNVAHFSGVMDDLRIHTLALSATELTGLMNDVNAAPVASDASFGIAEDALVSSTVGTVSATDPDAGDTLSYAITAGNAGGEFAINAATGEITTAAGLDFETTASYNLSVTVSDDAAPALSDTATVTINVTDVNEAPVANDNSGTIAEDVAIGTAVATVSASDVDAGDSLTYAITGGNTGNAFAIDNSGNITTAAALDYETTASYTLTVTVTDSGSLTDTATVNVTVTDVVETTAPVVATGSVTNIAMTTADLGYSITDDGGEAPSVTLYYGETDGGTTPASWANSVAVGAKATGAYTESISGLTEGTNYFFTLAATNSVGTTWGSTSSFTTVADTSPKMVRTTVNSVSSTTWTTVDLGKNYNSAVIVATPIYADSTQVPVVTRIRNVAGSSFELKLDRADGLTAETTCNVSVVAVEEGVYTLANDGVQMEAVKFTSTVTANKTSWSAEARSYTNSYTTPVVVGQVMSANDANWSVFWSMGNTRTAPADASNFNVGKHVAEDSNTTRANETIGYIVIEAGNGSINGVNYEAGLGADTVRNTSNNAAGYSYALTGLSSASAGAISSAAMDGADGGWPVFFENDALSASAIKLIIDEDDIGDSESSHTTEQVNYIIFE